MSFNITFPRAAVTVTAVLAAAAISPTIAHATQTRGSMAGRAVAPAAALRPLSVLIGSWRCTGQVTGPDGSTQSFDTTSTTRFILNGNFMRWQESNSIAGTPIGAAEYIWGWNAQHGYFTADRFDDAGQRGSQRSPGWAGNALTLTGALNQTDGSSLPLVTTLTLTGKKTFTVRSVADLGAVASGATVVSQSSCTR